MPIRGICSMLFISKITSTMYKTHFVHKIYGINSTDLQTFQKLNLMFSGGNTIKIKLLQQMKPIINLTLLIHIMPNFRGIILLQITTGTKKNNL